MEDSAGLQTELREAEAALEAANESLAEDAQRDRLDSILRRVSNEITRIASALNLEHVIGVDGQENPVTLDIRNLTLIVDKAEGPVTFHEIGSGKNWLGYGIAMHLALHRHFVAQDRLGQE